MDEQEHLVAVASRTGYADWSEKRDHHLPAFTPRSYAIERVIQLMHGRFREALTLQMLADHAQLSPFYFNRLFKSITGVSPCIFLCMVRLAYAKRLILMSKMSIKDICIEVGYQSIGTFTTRFTRYVGMSPMRLRKLTTESVMQFKADELLRVLPRKPYLSRKYVEEKSSAIIGELDVPQLFRGLVFMGIFRSATPQGKPLASAIVMQPDRFLVPALPDGIYYLFLAVLDETQTMYEWLCEGSKWRMAREPFVFTVKQGRFEARSRLQLIPPAWFHPPALIVLPYFVLSPSEV